jgi:two-component system phosphate regulon response regulator PhoB
MGAKILIVDDEAGIRQMLAFALTGDGYDVIDAPDAHTALELIQRQPPDLLLLDWMLPGLSGIDLCRKLKRDPKTGQIAIILITAKGEEQDKVRGLDSGADDYVAKPFSTRELLARIRAVLRRSETADAGPAVFDVDELRVDRETHRVTLRGETLNLSPTEFRLLVFFVTHPERVYTRAQLLDGVWGTNTFIEERTVDVHIRRLRKLLGDGDFDRYIQTVRGVGYRFSTQPS